MYLGFDLGTTNVKALVVDATGRIVAAGSAPVERTVAADGAVEQDIEQIWAATCAAIGQAVRGIDATAVRAVGVSSQGGAIQVLDGCDRPLGRVIGWLDRRGRPFDLELVAELGPDFLAQRIGHGGSTMTLGQVLRLNRQSPGLLRKPHRLGFVGDVIVGRLCARRVHDPTSLGIALLYNPWLRRADPEILARLQLDESQLPELASANTPAGVLCDDVARQIGLPPGIPVSPAVHDQYTASLGAGAVSVGDVNFGAGTAWVLLANTGRLAPPLVHQAFACSHPVPGVFGQMLSLNNGGSAVDWVMALVGQPAANVAQVDDYVEQAPPGSDGLRCWPLLASGSEASPPFQAGARLDGITVSHRPCDVVRAVIEGLACELARHLRRLTAGGFPVCRLSMCGRAAASRNTPQIIADVTGLSVACVAVSDVSALGAAMIARTLGDASADLAAVARAWSPSSRVLQPGPDRGVYGDLLAQYLAPFELSAVEALPR